MEYFPPMTLNFDVYDRVSYTNLTWVRWKLSVLRNI